ncbi:MAG: DUF3276 family protein [Candidatus Margulisbacteria bacterium]|nr:DUF3276 family protein [Candidatus Margulisiibacteriota bacterium]
METMEKKSKDLFNRMVKAGRRTYFISVREAKNNQKYITITESKLVDKDKFDRFSIMVFQDKVSDFVDALEDASEVVA